MKLQILVMVVLVALFSGMAHADSACQAGTFDSVMGTSCTIGDKTFSFSSAPSRAQLDTYDNSGNLISAADINPSSIFFTPLPTSTSSGFSLSLFPGTLSTTSTYQIAQILENFGAIPSIGSITSSVITINGITQNGTTSDQDSVAALFDSANSQEYADIYSSRYGAPTEFAFPGGAEPGFQGSLDLFNDSYNGPGSTGFTSADFVFNESTTTAVPEGSGFGMLGLSGAAIFGALKRKSSFGRGE